MRRETSVKVAWLAERLSIREDAEACGTYTASNASADVHAQFRGGAAHFRAAGETPVLELELIRWGRSGEMRAAGAAKVAVDGAQLTYDRIRLRVTFLGALSPTERERMLDGAERRLGEVLANTRCDLEGSGEEPLERLSTLGGLRVLEARLAWVREVREHLTELDGEQGERE